jgi:hypothetical protein
VGDDKRPRTIRSRHAAHRATKYPIGCLLGASSRSISTTPDASPRTIAPGAPSLKLRDAPVVTFHVTIGAFGQTGRKPATLPFRNCRFLSVRKRHCCCRRNPEHKQKNRHSVNVRAHPGAYKDRATTSLYRVGLCRWQQRGVRVSLGRWASRPSNASGVPNVCRRSLRSACWFVIRRRIPQIASKVVTEQRRLHAGSDRLAIRSSSRL